MEKKGDKDIWVELTEADFVYSNRTKSRTVAAVYQAAFEGANSFTIEAVRRQLEIYHQLKVLPDNVKAALDVIPDEKNMNSSQYSFHSFYQVT